MSRYALLPHETVLATIPHAVVSVGWDNPVATFFGMVLDPDRPLDQDEVVFWVGKTPGEIPSLERLCILIAPWARMPEDIRARLIQDYHERQEPTPLQQQMLAILKRGQSMP